MTPDSVPPEPPEPYYDEDGITIYCGDCMDVLPTLGRDRAEGSGFRHPPGRDQLASSG